MKLLVVNADDFGFTRDVNLGIVEACREGILTSTTIMANGNAFDHAVALARQCPALDVGGHLVLIGGRSLLPPHKPYPRSVAGLLRALARRECDIRAELAAQVRRIVDAGIAPTHLDTHKHTHLVPPVLEAVARVAREFGIRWIRKPVDIPLQYGAPLAVRLAGGVIRRLGRRFGGVLGRYGCRTTDHFAGFALTGRCDGTDLVRLIEQLPDGTTEFMCHPGYCSEELRGAETRLKESRARELEALKSAAVRNALTRHGIRIASFRDLP